MKESRDGALINLDPIIGYMREGYAFSIATNLINLSTGESPFLQLTNPIGSGKVIMIDSITLGADSSASRIIARFYINPTITGVGTSITPGNNLVGSSITSIATASRQPTNSSNGSFIAVFLKGAPESSFIIKRNFALMPGVTALITIEPSQNNTPCHAAVFWLEFSL